MSRRLAMLIAALLVVGACTQAPGAGGGGGGAAGGGGGGGAAGSVDAIKQRGRAIIGVKFDVAGFGLRNPTTGEIEGLDADLGREIVKELGVQPQFIEAVSANRIPFLEQDKVDLIISTFTINDERKQKVDFSLPYYIAGQRILVKKDSPYQSIDDLAGKRVCSAQGSTSEKNVRTKVPTAQLVLFKTYTEGAQALMDGRCEAVSTDDQILHGLTTKYPQTEVRGEAFSTEPYGIGIKKGRTDLVEFVNSTLQKMKGDGRLQAMYKKWIKTAAGEEVTVPF